MAPSGDRLPDQLVAFRFKVEIEGIGVFRFQTCSIPTLQMTTDVIASGGSPKHIFNAPSPAWDWNGDVQLKRGMAPDGVALWRWVMDTATKSRPDPHSITVTLLQQDGTDGIAWTFLDAYPIGWKLDGEMNAGSDALATETFTFTHQGADIVFPGGSYQNIGAPEAPAEKSAAGSGSPSDKAGSNASSKGAGGTSGGASTPGADAGQKGAAPNTAAPNAAQGTDAGQKGAGSDSAPGADGGQKGGASDGAPSGQGTGQDQS